MHDFSFDYSDIPGSSMITLSTSSAHPRETVLPPRCRHLARHDKFRDGERLSLLLVPTSTTLASGIPTSITPSVGATSVGTTSISIFVSGALCAGRERPGAGVFTAGGLRKVIMSMCEFSKGGHVAGMLWRGWCAN